MTGVPFDPLEGLFVLAAVGVLLVVVVLLSYVRRIGVGKDFTAALLIGGVQLTALALFLTWLFATPLWYIPIWGLLGVMVVVGGYQSARRASEMPGAWKVTTPSILGGAVIVLVVLAASGAMPLEPQFIVPLAGMVFGNSMRLCSLTLDRLVRELRLGRAAVETSLSLGATSAQAMEDYGRISVRAALIPTIDNLRTLGIIFIPGAMAGLLIAGADPLVAAQYQIIIFLMIVGGGIITALLVSWLARGHIFTEAEQVQGWV